MKIYCIHHQLTPCNNEHHRKKITLMKLCLSIWPFSSLEVVSL